ncbi:MAG: hypothetical protein ACYTF5_22205 [Planctomycetota bacterium]|jgi:hypothetical protein
MSESTSAALFMALLLTRKPAAFAIVRNSSAGPVFIECVRPRSVRGQPPKPPFQFTPNW